MARYIDADKLINEISGNGGVFVYGAKVVAAIVSRINVQPTADVAEVKHGEWKASVMGTGAPHCSLCNGATPLRYTYCPHCGAKMDERS